MIIAPEMPSSQHCRPPPNCFFFRHRYHAASGVIAVALHSILLGFMGNLAHGHVYSDYERLRSVVIGRADNFQLPESRYEPLEDESEMAHNVGVTNIKRYLMDESGAREKEWDESGDADDYDDYEPFDEHLKKGTHGMRYPQAMIDERNQAMDNLARILEGRGVKVWRTNSTATAHQTKADGGKGDSARDLMMTIGDTLFLTPTPFRSRAHEVDEVFQHLHHPDRDASLKHYKVVDLRLPIYWKRYKEFGYNAFLRRKNEPKSDLPITEEVPLFNPNPNPNPNPNWRKSLSLTLPTVSF